MRKPRLPDLDRLSPAEKDALIVSLWETVQALDRDDAPATEAEAVAAPQEGPVQVLRQRIGSAAPSRRNQTRADATRRLTRLLDYRPLQIVIALIALAYLADVAISWYQRQQAAARHAEKQRVEQAASSGLFMELLRAGYVPEQSAYQATLRIERIGADGALYILQNPPRVFVQTGLTWQEVPSRAADGKPWGVLTLEGGADVTVLFDADIEGWAELMPGYMHVQIQLDQLIGLTRTPGDDIVARNNRFYFYLKPHDADDEDIRRRARFTGTPPAFLPMPPH